MQNKISTKLLIAFAVIFSFIALQSVLLVIDLRILDERITEVELYSQEIDQIHDIQSGFMLLIAPVHDYVITGDKEEIPKYQKENELLEARLNKLYKFPLLVEDEIAVLDKAVVLLKDIDGIARRIFAIQDPANNSQAASLTEELDTLADEASAQFDNYHIIAHKERTSELEETNAWYARMFYLTVIFSVFLLLLSFALAYLLSRLIVEPIGKLTAASRSLAEGQYTEIDIGEREDELGLLVQAFNNMSSQIRSNIKSIANYAQQMEVARRRAVDREKSVRTMAEAGNIVSSSIKTEEITDSLQNFVGTLAKARAVSIFMYNRSTNLLKCDRYTGFENNEIGSLKIEPDDSSAIARSFISKETILLQIADDTVDEVLKRILEKEGLYHVALIPLKARDKVLGVVMLCNPETEKFNKRQMEYIQILANNVGSALNNALLHEDILEYEKKRQESEMAVAQKIQSSLLPQSAPEFAGLDIGFFSKQARQVGGDFFDFIKVDDKLVTTIGDVSGKSVSAALLTSMIRYILRSAVNSFDTVGPVRVLNKVLTEETTAEVYTTLLYLLLDTKNAKINLLNAGHIQPLMYRAAQDELFYITNTPQMPLGINKDILYKDEVLEFRPGDMLVLFTDGIVEARARSSAEQFGYDYLMTLIRENIDLKPKQLVQVITDNVIEFSSGELKDDLALIVIKATR